MTGADISVLAAPQFDAGAGRVELTLPQGLTLAEMVRRALPGANDANLRRMRVALVGDGGMSIIQPALWHAVRPKPGVRVVIRMIPGKSAMRSILTIVISIAAIATGQLWGASFASAMGLGTSASAMALGQSMVALGVNIVGSLLVNALVPPVKPEDRGRNSYTISGWRNRYDPDGAVPVVLGSIRYAPPFAAMSWSEIEGDVQYIRSLFLFGEGEIDLTDFRIGETSIGEYHEVQMEVRRGIASDLPASLYPRQILEEAIGVELTRPMPRDDAGNIIDDNSSIETPVVRATAADTDTVSVILGWPGGLVYMDEGERRGEGVDIRIEQRLAGAEEWELVETLQIRARRSDAFYRQHSWKLPQRGKWQIRLTMMTEEPNNPGRTRMTQWVALQSIRPEYPLAVTRPMALVAMRVKATHQISGMLDNFSARASRVCLDWDQASGTWIKRATTNPASLYRLVLQHPSNPKAVPNAGIDLQQLQDWHGFCKAKGLAYNRVLDQAGTSLRDALTEIAAAGRASPRQDGMRWGVVIDRPSDLLVDHVSPRNSFGFKVSRSYVEHPHALVVKFQDETNDFKETERVIRRPGYAGDIDLTEALDMPGITDPAMVWREGVRRWYEILHRPDVYEITQDGAVRVATRGDTIALNHDVLSKVQRAARVRAVTGNLIQLDEDVTMVAGQSYGIRFRRISAADTIGTSDVRIVVTEAGTTDILTLSGTGPMPEIDDLILFGVAGQESVRVVVTRTEATEDMCTILRCVDAAPQIDTLTDAAAIPAWSGRVGAEIAENLIAPPAPRWTRVFSAVTENGAAVPLEYLITAGNGPIRSAQFEIDRRLVDASGWTTVTIPAANGGGSFAGYTSGQNIQLRARAISPTGIPGPYGPVVTHLMGDGGTGIPGALDADSVTVNALLGGGLIQFAAGADPNLDKVQLYRARTATLNRTTDKVGRPMAISAGGSYSFAVGDTTRQNQLKSAAWTAGGGWTVSAGVATHTAGTAGELSQPLSLINGRWYRLGHTVAGRSTGSVTPCLTGGSTVSGGSVAANGDHTARLQAVSGNNSFMLDASSNFDGALSGIALYLETAACLGQGTHYLWLEPQSNAGLAGPVAGPFILEVI